jgi:hypothetical protein
MMLVFNGHLRNPKTQEGIHQCLSIQVSPGSGLPRRRRLRWGMLTGKL